MANLIRTVKSCFAAIDRWMFDNDKVSIDRRYVTYVRNWRK